MKHLEPEQLARAVSAEPSNKKTSPARWAAAITVLALGLGAAGTWLFPTNRTDNVTQQERDSRQSTFARTSALSLPSVAADQINRTLDEMKLSPSETEKLRSILVVDSAKSARPNGAADSAPLPKPTMQSLVRLVTVTLWDTHDQDGDVVTVVSAGYRREIILTNAPQSVSFPVDNVSVVQFTGIHDGGGGITLGIRGPQQEMLMPIMSEGQTITLPVTN